MKHPSRGIAALVQENERLVIGLASVGLFLILWQGLAHGWWAALLRPLLGEAAAAFSVRPIFISSPSGIATAAWSMFFVTGEIWPHIAESGRQVVLGLAAAAFVGVPLGLAAGRYKPMAWVVDPFLAALNATPQVAFLPLLVMWVGAGFTLRVLIIFLLCVIPITMNALAAVRTVDARLLRVARSFNASEAQVFRTIITPSALPFLISGLRLAIGRSMIGVVVGELYGSAWGIGIMINKAGATFDTDKMFVGVLVIVVVGLFFSEVLRAIERRLEVWRPAVGAEE